MRPDEYRDMQTVWNATGVAQKQLHRSEISDVLPYGNSRYATEIFGVLANKGLGTVEDGTFIPDHWDTVEERWAVFHQAIPAPNGETAAAEATGAVKVTKAAKAAKAAGAKASGRGVTGKCGCGCGQDVTKSFKPGHDARMVSQNVAAVADLLSTVEGEEKAVAEIVRETISAHAIAIRSQHGNALAEKFVKAALNAVRGKKGRK